MSARVLMQKNLPWTTFTYFSILLNLAVHVGRHVCLQTAKDLGLYPMSEVWHWRCISDIIQMVIVSHIRRCCLVNGSYWQLYVGVATVRDDRQIIKLKGSCSIRKFLVGMFLWLEGTILRIFLFKNAPL